MEIRLKRIACRSTHTVGRLTIEDSTFECDTLEDVVRDTNHNGIFDGSERKVAGQSAIPYGRYRVTLGVQSPRFKKSAAYAFCDGRLPRLLGVPHFEGILIHIGNSVRDTEGCILVGINDKVGLLSRSTDTFKELYAILKAADEQGDDIWITIG